MRQNKELEATEERKRKAKQLEMQRKETGRSGGRAGGMSRPPVYPTYTPPVRPAVTETFDTYEAEKNKSKCVVVPLAHQFRGIPY